MGIIEVISAHTRIMCDTAPIIYFIEEHQRFGPPADSFFKYALNQANTSVFSSVITLAEVLTHPLRQGRTDLVEKYRDFLLNADNFMLYSIDAVIAEKSAELRSKYSLKTPDAIQIAAGIENSASLFITNDERLKGIDEIEVLALSDYC